MNRLQRFLLTMGSAAIMGGASGAGVGDISSIDKNFKPSTVGDLEVCYFNALEQPFELTGFPWRKPGEALLRVPETFTVEQVNAGVLDLAKHTSGGAVRFRTDSPWLTLRSKLRHGFDMNHMPRAGSCGFDLFLSHGSGSSYIKTIQPAVENLKGQPLEAQLFKGAPEMREWTLYLPLYGGVESLEIGVAPGHKILPPTPQRISRPILFYGSSITQGGCASRPANCYTTMLCRELDAPQINLGFSGSALGEKAMAEAIAGLDLAALVLDYDYNAPDSEHLRATHEPFFMTVRKAHPELPVIIMSRCSGIDGANRKIIRQTWQNALDRGDKKVWFIDGAELFGEPGANYCTVDGCHPNDLGFYEMFRRVLPVLRKALGE